jgi:hypothetical protein
MCFIDGNYYFLLLFSEILLKLTYFPLMSKLCRLIVTVTECLIIEVVIKLKIRLKIASQVCNDSVRNVSKCHVAVFSTVIAHKLPQLIQSLDHQF